MLLERELLDAKIAALEAFLPFPWPHFGAAFLFLSVRRLSAKRS